MNNEPDSTIAAAILVNARPDILPDTPPDILPDGRTDHQPERRLSRKFSSLDPENCLKEKRFITAAGTRKKSLSKIPKKKT